MLHLQINSNLNLHSSHHQQPHTSPMMPQHLKWWYWLLTLTQGTHSLSQLMNPATLRISLSPVCLFVWVLTQTFAHQAHHQVSLIISQAADTCLSQLHATLLISALFLRCNSHHFYSLPWSLGIVCRDLIMAVFECSYWLCDVLMELLSFTVQSSPSFLKNLLVVLSPLIIEPSCGSIAVDYRIFRISINYFWTIEFECSIVQQQTSIHFSAPQNLVEFHIEHDPRD